MNTFNYEDSVKRVQMIFARYRPATHLMYEINDINCGKKDLESFIQEHDSELNKIESMDPVIAGQFEVTNYMRDWGLQYNGESVVELRQMALQCTESTDIATNNVSSQFDVNSDDLVHCIYGTSRTRAEEWRDHGLGFVWTEKMFPNGSRIGLQVNCPGLDECRCNLSRLNFYASVQSDKSLNEEPVIVEFDIPAKYIYCENNRGEFQIEQESWKECRNFKIHDTKSFKF